MITYCRSSPDATSFRWGLRVLVGLLPPTHDPWIERHEAGHLRRAPWAQASGATGLRRRYLAACRVHFMRNALTAMPKAADQMVAVTIRTVIAQPDRATARTASERVCRLFQKRFPKLVECLSTNWRAITVPSTHRAAWQASVSATPNCDVNPPRRALRLSSTHSNCRGELS